MSVQAIWENGVFRPLHPISIKHTTLTIVVPDEEIATTNSEVLPAYDLNYFPIEVREEVARIQAISDAVLTMPLPKGLNEVESEEQEQRTRAFELRKIVRNN